MGCPVFMGACLKLFNWEHRVGQLCRFLRRADFHTDVIPSDADGCAVERAADSPYGMLSLLQKSGLLRSVTTVSGHSS